MFHVYNQIPTGGTYFDLILDYYSETIHKSLDLCHRQKNTSSAKLHTLVDSDRIYNFKNIEKKRTNVILAKVFVATLPMN